MNDIEELLKGYTAESGAITPEDTGAVDDAVVHRLDDVTENSLAAEISSAADAGEVADHLDEIGDRAEVLAEANDTLTAEVAIESLHREFNTVVRAWKLPATAESFESAGSDEGRMRGLARDARRSAEIARECRALTLDFSAEGRIMEFLRRDKAKLESANKALEEAMHMLTPIAAKLREGGVILKHDGFRRFLTVEGKEVNDLDAALHRQTELLTHAHDAALKGLSEVVSMAKSLLGTNVKAGVANAMNGRHFGELSNVATAKGGLLGNFTINAKDKPGKMAHLAVPVFSRSNEHSFSKMGLAKGVGTATWKLFVGSVRHAAIQGAIGQNGNRFAHGVNDALHTASDVDAIKKGVDKYHQHVNASKMKSAATYEELVKAAEMVRGYVKFTTDRLNLDDFESALKSARGNTATLTSEEKSDLKGVCSALEDAAGRIAGLESVVYEQAVYTTTLMASLIKNVVDKIE
jgi:hypothetical protein